MVCYDIANRKRLQKVGRRMERFGRRIQYSIFLCLLDSAGLRSLKDMIHQLIDPSEDRILILPICTRCEEQREEVGLASWHDFRKTAVIL
jgi:CRISPR-associated protein Cas2